MEMTAKDLGLIPARLSLAATMLNHGLAKVRPEGSAASAPFFEQLGFRPGARWAFLAGAAELLAGATLALGIATRIGALAVLGTQAVAVAKVHGPKGFDNMGGGWEFNALIMATALGVLVAGPGTVSLHEVLERRLQGRGRWLFQPRRAAAVGVTKLLK